MAVITFSGGATLQLPGTAAQVASALSAPRDGAMFATFPGGVRVNPDQIAFVIDESSDEMTDRPGARG
jgi:hypothetical protein